MNTLYEKIPFNRRMLNGNWTRCQDDPVKSLEEQHADGPKRATAMKRDGGAQSLLTSLLEPTRQESVCVRYEPLQNRETLTEFAIGRRPKAMPLAAGLLRI
jgi:hypothetical protein